MKLTVLNLDDPGSKSTAEKFGVWGSTLLLVDAAGHKTDLTGLAFRSARNDPEAFRQELRTAIQQHLTPDRR